MNVTVAGKRLARTILKYHQLYLFLLPAVFCYILFAYMPMGGIIIAFKNFTPLKGIIESPWAVDPLIHFKRFFGSYQFGSLMTNTILLSMMQLVLSFPMPIILALSLNQCTNRRLQKLVQNCTYIPFFISTVVFVGMINVFVARDGGLLNNLLGLVGMEPVYFLGDAKYFRPIFVLSTVWQTAGWNAIIYIAALSGISGDLHEAAIVDGAGKFKRVLHVDLPGIMPTIVTMLILNMGQIMNISFEKVLLMQTPVNLSVAEVISTYVYARGIQGGQYSFSTAVTLFNSLINTFMIVTVNGIVRKVSDKSLW